MIFNKDNTFCITLPHAKERQQRMQQRFQHFQMEVTMWPASTPDTLVDVFHGAMNRTEKACAQSHLLIWKHIVEKGLEYALILEDDACFDKEWKHKLDRFYEQMQDKAWDMIMLNASESMPTLHTWLPCTEQYLAAGYILSRKGAQGLLSAFEGYYYSSDWMLTRMQRQGHSYAYHPWLIIQEGKSSFLREDCGPDRRKVERLLNEISYDLENYV